MSHESANTQKIYYVKNDSSLGAITGIGRERPD